MEPTSHISIFDKGHEKSEQEKQSTIVASARQGLNQTTARFTCVPVTSYHEMVEQDRKRA